MSNYTAHRNRAIEAIDRARMSEPAFDERGRQSGYRVADRGSIAIAESILALAEAIRPAPVEVTVNVDEDQIAQSVRDAMGGGSA